MDELDGDGRRVEQFGGYAETLTGRVHEQRPYPLAAVEDGVAHRLVQARRSRLRSGQRLAETPVDAVRVSGDTLFEMLWQGHEPEDGAL